MKCPNDQPHMAHWHTIRADGVTVAGGKCAGVPVAAATRGSATEHEPAPHADRDGSEERYPDAVRSLVNAAKAEGKAQRTIADLRAEVETWRARYEVADDEAKAAEAALARVEALAETWERGYNSPTASSWAKVHADLLRAAIAEPEAARDAT